MLKRIGEAMPPCGVPNKVCSNFPLSINPHAKPSSINFKNFLSEILLLKILIMVVGFTLSKAALISPSMALFAPCDWE